MGYTNDELRHFGVLGMKWGRRMARSSASALRDEGQMLKEDAQSIRKWGKEAAAKQRVKNKKAAARVEKNAKWYDDASKQAFLESRLKEKKAKYLDRQIKLKEKSNAERRAIQMAKIKAGAQKTGTALKNVGNRFLTGKTDPVVKDYAIGITQMIGAVVITSLVASQINKNMGW